MKEIELTISKDKLNSSEIMWNIKEELLFLQDSSFNLFNRITFSKRILNCTLGLEDHYKNTFALFISGLLGHSWDFYLRFFRYQNSKDIETEIKKFQLNTPNFIFLKHIGNPLASILYDFKNLCEPKILGVYNSEDFNRVLSKGMLRIRDNCIGTKEYAI